MRSYCCTLVLVFSCFVASAQFTNIGSLRGNVVFQSLSNVGDNTYAIANNLVYISTNKGASWQILSQFQKENIQSKIFGEGDNLVFVGAEEDFCYEYIYVFLSKDGGKSWGKKKVHFSNWFLLDRLSVAIKNETIVFSSDNILLWSTNGGSTFQERTLNGCISYNGVHFLNGEFVIVEQNNIRTTTNFIDFKNINMSGVKDIRYHFATAEKLYIYDDKLKVFNDSTFETIGIADEDFDYSTTDYFDGKVYLYSQESIHAFDENETKIQKINLYKHLPSINSYRIFDLYRGILYCQTLGPPFSTHRNSLDASISSVKNISEFSQLLDGDIFSVHNTLWHNKHHLSYYETQSKVWRKTPFETIKNELYGVVGKNEVFAKKPQTAIFDLNGLKVRNSGIPSDITSLRSCENMLIGINDDKKYYGLHKGVLPWIEIPIPTTWTDFTANYSNGMYILHNKYREILISRDGYAWDQPINTNTIGDIVDVKFTEDGQLICATKTKIFSYDIAQKLWQPIPVENLPFEKSVISGFEVYKNVLVVLQHEGGVAYSADYGLHWQKWDDGLPNFDFTGYVLNGDALVVRVAGEFYQRNLQEIPGLSSTKEDFTMMNSLLVYPNPVKDLLSFQALEGVNVVTVDVKNIYGDLVLSRHIGDEATMYVSGLPSGVYLIEAKTNKGLISSKFLKVD